MRHFIQNWENLTPYNIIKEIKKQSNIWHSCTLTLHSKAHSKIWNTKIQFAVAH